jgi:hypothetical protein
MPDATTLAVSNATMVSDSQRGSSFFSRKVAISITNAIALINCKMRRVICEIAIVAISTLVGFHCGWGSRSSLLVFLSFVVLLALTVEVAGLAFEAM